MFLDRFEYKCCRKFGGGSSGGSQPAQVQQTNDPWSGQQPFLSSGQPSPEKGVYQYAYDAFKSTPKEAFQGPYLADPNSLQKGALDERLALASGIDASGTGGQMLKNVYDVAAGKFLDPSTNPTFQNAVAAAINPVEERYRESILPQINANSVSSGAYSGNAPDFARVQAAGDFAREAGDIASKMAYTNYAAERGYQMQAPQLLSAALGGAQLPTTLREGVGEVQQAWSQDDINEALQRYTDAQNAPWIGLPQYASIVSGGSPGGSTNAQYTYNGPSTASQVIWGGLGGAALGGLAGDAFGYSGMSGLGPWALGGGLLGGLAGGL